LLSGEKVSLTDYQRKAEGNMMNLMKENEENRKIFILSIMVGVITIIAFCALIVIASFIDLPTIVRIILILVSVGVAVAGIAAASMLDIKSGYFECQHCKELFVPSMDEYVKGYHTFTRRRLTCPKCGKTGMCKHRIVR
ncbi:MAG: transcriptional regulator, partial [Anaerostipes sp.]|nr:transcriptional regulator [Anaerostipes sp.]